MAKQMVIEEVRSYDLKMRTKCSNCSSLWKAKYY
jgi:hypothetical protein